MSDDEFRIILDKVNTHQEMKYQSMLYDQIRTAMKPYNSHVSSMADFVDYCWLFQRFYFGLIYMDIFCYVHARIRLPGHGVLRTFITTIIIIKM